MNRVKLISLTAGLALALAFAFSCESAGGSSAFVGKWVTEDGSSAPRGLPDDLELFKDGTGVIENFSISWKVENKRFVISSSLKGSAYDYEISDRILKLTDDKGEEEIYVKLQEGKIEGKTLTDKRDGKKYKTVIIGTQTWMAENLNYNAKGSKCYGEGGEVVIDFENEKPITKKLSDKEVQNNCARYGRLYDWETAKAACPSGWHLPSEKEYELLDRVLGGEKMAGKKLKATSGWNDDGNGTDQYGFSALPGGLGDSGGSFNYVGYHGGWWSASEYNSNDAYRRYMNYGSEYAYWNSYDKSSLFSVRCLQD